MLTKNILVIVIVCSLFLLTASIMEPLNPGDYFSSSEKANALRFGDHVDEPNYIEFCDSELARDAGFVPVRHKVFGYTTCIRI